MARISIIVPVYNVPESYFRQAMTSVLAQSYTDYEVLLIDDGSTNGCDILCDEYAKADGRFRAIHKPNGGVSSARNAGLRAATGEWLIFLDADDWWELDLLQKAMAAETPEIDMVLFSFDCLKDGQTIPNSPEAPSGNFEILGSDAAKLLQYGLMIQRRRQYPFYNGVVWCQLVRRKIVQDHDVLFDETLKQCEDTLWNMELLEYVRVVAFWNQPLYHYRIDSQSAYHRFNDDLKKQIENINQKLLTFGVDNKKSSDYWNAYELWLMRGFIRILRLDLFHPQNPKSENEKRKEWNMLLVAVPSLKKLRTADLKKLGQERKMYLWFWFFLFVYPSYYLTRSMHNILHRCDKI